MNGEGRHIIAISNEEFARMDKVRYQLTTTQAPVDAVSNT